MYSTNTYINFKNRIYIKNLTNFTKMNADVEIQNAMAELERLDRQFAEMQTRKQGIKDKVVELQKKKARLEKRKEISKELDSIESFLDFARRANNSDKLETVLKICFSSKEKINELISIIENEVFES
jgi:hypothetical protein